MFIKRNALDLGELTVSPYPKNPKCLGPNLVYKTRHNTNYGHQSEVYAMHICRLNLVLLGSGSVERIEEEDDGGGELHFLLSPSLDELGGRRRCLPMATRRRRTGGTSLRTSVAMGRNSSVARVVTSTAPDPPAQALFSPTCLDAGGEARRIEGSAPGDVVASALMEEAEVSLR
jgi:hypothetical protein